MNGRYVYLGKHDTPESEAEYRRVLAELRAGRSPAPSAVASRPTPVVRTVNEVLLAFYNHAEGYYRRPDGTPTNELKEYRLALRPVKELYGHTPADEFDAVALDAVRSAMVKKGWCRSRVNKQVGRIKAAFKWAAGRPGGGWWRSRSRIRWPAWPG